jgi:Sortase domain
VRLVAWLAAALLLAGCGMTSAPPAESPGNPFTVAAPSPAATVDTPTRLTYESVGIDAQLEPTSLDSKGAIAVPALDQAAEVDYLAWDPAFGAGRPLVVVSHVNGRSPNGTVIPGGFLRLSEAKRGDAITVTAATGATAVYQVTDVRTVVKEAFPSDIYRVRSVPTLVAITCGGDLDRATHSYRSNVIVTAEIT